jgi:quercetin dioxygenase-like cupin family protein
MQSNAFDEGYGRPEISDKFGLGRKKRYGPRFHQRKGKKKWKFNRMSNQEGQDGKDRVHCELDRKMQFQALSNAGAEKVKVNYLMSKSAGTGNFFLTYYSIMKGGHTPLDNHVNEHEVFIMRGKGRAMGTDEQHELAPRDAIYIKSNEVHQLVNTGNEPLEFLCVKGADELHAS